MRKLKLCIALAFLGTFGLTAQDQEKSLLWEVSGNGLEKSSYIFGTIHATCDATLDDKTKKALDETSLVVMELDMDDPGLQAAMMQGMQMKDGKTIADMTTDEEYALLSDFFKEQAGIPLASLGGMKPFILSSLLLPKMLDCPMQSLEASLLSVAKEQGEEVLGLETVAEQLSVFDEIPYEDQLEGVLKSAKEGLEEGKSLMKEMMAEYEEGDISGLKALMVKDEDAMTAKHLDVLLDNRNKNWIPKIITHAKEQPTFFGVGAGHLAGEMGVIKLLEKEGYTVKAVK